MNSSVVETSLNETTEYLEVKEFKVDCKTLSPEVIVQKHLIEGPSYFFNLYYDENEEFLFKKEISLSLGVHIRDIALVGSGKLGFSIKPEKDYPRLYKFKSFDHDYDVSNEHERSDLDVAIVSSEQFDKQLKNIYKHTDCYRSSIFHGNARISFCKYVLKGWLRPDMLPVNYKVSPSLEETNRVLSIKYQRKINIGIYKSWYYFEKYHQNNIHTLSINLIS